MGTRADFYVGEGKIAEWLGSIAWDGYEYDENENHPISKATTEKEFRQAVTDEIGKRDDGTKPEDGWPWPWDDSSLTDYTYAFVDGKTKSVENAKGFPDMKKIQNVNLGKRSGVMVIGVKENNIIGPIDI